MLDEVKTGEFAREWIEESDAGAENLLRLRKASRTHLIETVGKDLRSMMSWLRQNAEPEPEI